MIVAPRWVEHKHQPTPASPAPIVTDLQRLCSGQKVGSTFPEYSAYIEYPNGERDLLVSSEPGSAMTRHNWKAECVSNHVTLRSPDGKAFDLGDFSTAWRGQDVSPVMFELTFVLPALRVTDLSGNWISFDYRRVGATSPLSGPVPSHIEASDGRQLNFTYNETSRRLQSIFDNTGREWHYEHLPSDAESSEPTLTSVNIAGAETWHYTYHPSVGLLTTDEANATKGKLATLTYPEGGVVAFEYEPFDLKWSTDGSKPIEAKWERVKRRILSTGDRWEYSYVHGGPGQYDVTTEVGPSDTIVYRYMGSGYVAGYQVTNNMWRIGLLLERSDQAGNYERNTWTSRELASTPIQLTGPELVRDEKTWTAELAERRIVRDGVTYVTQYSVLDRFGNPGTVKEMGPAGETRTTNYSYQTDTAKWIIGKLKDTVSPSGTTFRTFDGNGNLLSTSQNGVPTSHSYDNQGNVASSTFPRGLVHYYSDYKRGVPQLEMQPDGITIRRIITDAGEIASETNGDGHTTTYEYDGLGRAKRIVPPIGNPTSIDYLSNATVVRRGSLEERTDFDGFRRISRITLGGITRSFEYDGLDRKIFESNPDSAQGTRFSYDTLNRPIMVTFADGTSRTTRYSGTYVIETNERGYQTRNNYRAYGDPDRRHLMRIEPPQTSAAIDIKRDDRDLVRGITQAGVTRTYDYNDNHYLVSVNHPETGITTYGRDAAGNMVARTVGNSGQSLYTYDGHNRLTMSVYPGSTPAVTTSYTKTHRLASVVTSVASRYFTYDDNNNLTIETLNLGSTTFATKYSYNANDQLSTMTYPRSGLAVNYFPDVLGRPTSVSGFADAINYWPSGMVKKISYSNGTKTAYQQNARLWPSAFSTSNGTNTFANTLYQYDGVGNLASISDSVDPIYNRSITNDAMDRVIAVTGPWGTGTMSYGASGNITSQVYGSDSVYHSYDANNRLSSISGTRAASFGYDAYGNITHGAARNYTYDGVPNLVCVNCADPSLKIEHLYDGLNRRVIVRKGGVTTYEFSDLFDRLLFTYSSTGKQIEYIYLGQKRIAQRAIP